MASIIEQISNIHDAIRQHVQKRLQYINDMLKLNKKYFTGCIKYVAAVVSC